MPPSAPTPPPRSAEMMDGRGARVVARARKLQKRALAKVCVDEVMMMKRAGGAALRAVMRAHAWVHVLAAFLVETGWSGCVEGQKMR